MIKNDKIEKITKIWDEYIKSNQMVLDTKGNELPNIDELRLGAIQNLSEIILQFKNSELSIGEFKTSIDSFNKRNNLWGFTAIKGQFFFNQLTKNLNDSGLLKIQELVKETISVPRDIKNALAKIEKLEKHCQNFYSKAKDKRLVPNPKSVGYFLSYFWQIADNIKWPIYYTASIQALDEIGLWSEKPKQSDNYEQFYTLNEEIKNILREYSKKEITNWEVEHAFWLFRGNPNKKSERKKNKPIIVEQPEKKEDENKLIVRASFNLSDYIIPKVSRLVELGKAQDKSATLKGYEFEKIVAEIFEQLDFEVEILGQGTGRNPDAIIKFREENTAFLVDAKAYNSGYSIGTADDRAIREYINHYCPKLQQNGYKKIGFIIVSNYFKTNFDDFINEITWNTEIKRFILLTSEALLYLLAFKTKNKLSLASIIESIIGFGNPVTAENIIDEFDDV